MPSIIIPARNGYEATSNCLASVLYSVSRLNLSCEFILVDDASDESENILKAFRDHRAKARGHETLRSSVANPKFARISGQHSARISDSKPHWQSIDASVVADLKFLNANATLVQELQIHDTGNDHRPDHPSGLFETRSPSGASRTA